MAVAWPPDDHALAVQAALIDIRDVTWLPGFDHVALESRSDVRLTNGIASSGNTSALMTAGSMDVTAARLYPTAGAVGTLVAGASAQTVQTVDYGPIQLPFCESTAQVRPRSRRRNRRWARFAWWLPRCSRAATCRRRWARCSWAA